MHAPDALRAGRERRHALEGCTVHVRGIGAAGCDSEVELREAFARFGPFVQCTVRPRTDDAGNNTSWALVTLGDGETKAAALSQSPVVGAFTTRY
eukprot:SAG25_NODE_4263_length_852_cov_1.254980_1_plen_95_part_00